VPKQKTYDYIWAMQIPSALCSNDAKSGYNCTIKLISVLCLCQLGALVSAVVSMTNLLTLLCHHVLSAFGNMDRSQGQEEWPDPVAGISQGNGVGPQIWAAVSMPLFNILREEGFLVEVICTMSLQYQTIRRFAFVDNTNLIVMNRLNEGK